MLMQAIWACASLPWIGNLFSVRAAESQSGGRCSSQPGCLQKESS